MSNQTTKRILSACGIKPKKRLGQNFLVSRLVVNGLIAAAHIGPGDTVLEVGPGLGALTIPLADKAKKVVVVEKDVRMSELLGRILRENNIKNVKIINQDILSSGCQPPAASYKMISNLPYNIAAAVIMKFLQAKNPPKTMAVMLQKEVGQRIAAAPPKMSKLAVFCQALAEPKIVGYVKKDAFWPRPKVDSAILRIEPKRLQGVKLLASCKEFNSLHLQEVVRAGFSHPRKQLLGNLSVGLKMPRDKVEQWLKQNNIGPSRRAETLSVEQWMKLVISLDVADEINGSRQEFLSDKAKLLHSLKDLR
ncbi:MAG: 16S rRNA (adenine(1518)-N(6)/adenine(1519)-N(6))-dimethyltransferase RsmA [Patescibacteria group bacterium]|nr:16S rRNA (adenine(1518)-N(6)/adenine(1519)-N(6))-dimethyltransferase RsmA [Patescibacteria group bacterium]